MKTDRVRELKKIYESTLLDNVLPFWLRHTEYGEWYGYLHRDGSISIPVKGSLWKGPFHLSRQLLYGIKLLDMIENGQNCF